MSLSKLSWHRTDSMARALDERAIRALVCAHYSFVWRLLRRLGVPSVDAEDAAQQVFIVAARNMNQLEADRVRSFLYGTALRVASNHRRGLRRRREESRSSEALGEDPGDSGAQDPERCVELSRASLLLDDLLARLPAKLRRALVLAEIEQLELSEIAALERIPRGTAASRLRNARTRFAALLQKHADRNPFGTLHPRGKTGRAR